MQIGQTEIRSGKASPGGNVRGGDLPFSPCCVQKTLRDGHFKALQGKLELLERLCRALQKERNDLNNRLSLLQKEGGQEMAAPSEDHPLEPTVREEEEAAEEEEEEEDNRDLFPDSLETEDVHQTPRPPEMDPPAIGNGGAVTEMENCKGD